MEQIHQHQSTLEGEILALSVHLTIGSHIFTNNHDGKRHFLLTYKSNKRLTQPWIQTHALLFILFRVCFRIFTQYKNDSQVVLDALGALSFTA